VSPAKRLALLATGLAAAIAGGYAWVKRPQQADQALVLYGNVDIREVEMAFRQSGRLATVTVDEGDRVGAGELLAELDAEPFQDALAVAEAEVQQASAEWDKLRRGYRAQEIAEARQSVRQAEAALRYAASELKRQSAVVTSGATTEKNYDLARSTRDQAAAQLAAAKEAWALKKEGSRREDIAAAEAKLAGARAALAQAKTALADTRLTATAPAIVLARVREPGSMVNASAPVYTLSLRDPLYVRAYVGERHLGRVVPGSKVTVRSDSSDKVYQGQIGFVSPRAEFTPKSVETTELRTDLVYRLRIIISDADEALRQGMPVTVQVGRNADDR
jgi:HlyD family secretion protein